jgi:formate-dependent nitrite reductase membrane component NrfD
MLSIATLYIAATTAIFAYTVQDHLGRSDTYFKAMMTYFSDQSCVFVLYNMVLSVAILLYRIFTALFFQQTMEGEIIVCLLLARK